MTRRIVWAFAALTAVVIVGTLGYMVVEGWPPLDSLYMTVITVGTVGFQEVHPLSDMGRVFTIALIFLGVAAIGFAFGQFVEFLVEGHLQSLWEGRRMIKRLDSLAGHTIVAGFGRVGSVVARTLAEEGAPFVVVDQSAEAQAFARDADWPFILGDATEEETLIAAGVERAGSMVTALSGDAENLFVTVSARALNPDIFIVARSSHASTEEKLRKAGADRVITPNVIGGRRMASMILQPAVNDYLDIVSGAGGVEFRLQEVELAPGSTLVGKTIAQARIREATGAQIVAILSKEGDVEANPSADTVLSQGERLVALGSRDQIALLAQTACRL
jgi:voltage-gated potassium channel